jgi:DNA ligase (NAD+)
MGKSGRLTPTAVFKPIIIDGTTVERASLTNLSIIKKLGLTNNCTVYVKKANCIIPQVTTCLRDGDSPIKIPKYCTVCGGETEVVTENASEVLMCKNSNCSGKLLGRLKFFVSKPAMNIDGISESILDFLIEKEWVKSFVDIYHLVDHKDEWQKCDGFGKKSVEKILDAIEKSRDVKLENFICALSIPNIGKSAAKTISDKFNGDYIEFAHAYEDYFDWTELNDFGETMAKNLESYLNEHYKDVNELASKVYFVKRETKVIFSNPFNGRTLCVTGKLNHFTRDSINAKISELGAKATGSVSKNTDYLITNEASGSSKYKKAIELNVPIITEAEFLEMIGENV